MLFYQIFIIFSIILSSLSVQIPIEEVELIAHKESGFKLTNSKILINRNDKIKGLIDDDDINFLHLEIYNVKVEQAKKKFVSTLEQFWNDARLIPIRIRNQLELIDIVFKKPKSAQIEVNELKNNIWSILIYLKERSDVMEIKFKIPENHHNDEFMRLRVLLDFI
ncbi:unnamed protein product [Paramecium sonneborni]|uniref:DUF4390 domain-containing protein n=1 Tax=Paramecium sonneborni TaxID=65129 RepID=A0A8S1LMD2_9CILI|nr:unnamed protein product [Paramecium sonneborni]